MLAAHVLFEDSLHGYAVDPCRRGLFNSAELIFSRLWGCENEMIRITHVINNLQVGGAELSLKRLLKGVDRGRFESTVISLIGDGTVAPQLRKQGFDVVALGAARGRISPRTLLDLR